MKQILMNILLTIYMMCFISLSYAAPPGTSVSRPNASGGYDFFDSSGKKIGSSSKTYTGYEYYDAYGNKTSSVNIDKDTGKTEFRNAEGIITGQLSKDPLGKYRYTSNYTDRASKEQLQIRSNFVYSNPYGSGIDTVAPDTLQGRDIKAAEAVLTGVDVTNDVEGLTVIDSEDPVSSDFQGLSTNRTSADGLIVNTRGVKDNFTGYRGYGTSTMSRNELTTADTGSETTSQRNTGVETKPQESLRTSW